MEINKEEVRIAMDGIGRMGAWGDTPQGHEYWRKVYMELKHLFGGTEQPEPSPQYRAPNQGDIGKEIEVYVKMNTWKKTKLWGIVKGFHVCEVEHIGGAPIVYGEARIAIEPPQPPEPEWITPTDEDAKRRPEVEVSDGGDEWEKATLVFVEDESQAKTKRVPRFLVFYSNFRPDWRYQCRMRKDAT